MANLRMRVCPSCGAKNKPRWEFCVRCGEELGKVPSPATAEGAKAASAGAAPPGEFPWLGFGGGLLLVVLVFGGLAWHFRPRDAGPVDPGIFRVPRDPVAVATPATLVSGSSELSRGLARLEVGDFQGAVDLIGQAVQKNPDDAGYRQAYARALWARGSLSEATAEVRRAIELEPGSATYRFDLAKLLQAAGETDDAIRAYEEARGLGAASLQDLRNLAALYEKAGNYGGVAGTLRLARDMQPDDAGIGTDLGYALAQTGDRAGAIEAYNTVLARNPDAPMARSLLAELLLGQGKGDEAVEVLKAGLTAQSGTPLLHRSLGSVLERTGKTAQAAAAYREYVRLAPNAEDAAALRSRAERLEKAQAERGRS